LLFIVESTQRVSNGIVTFLKYVFRYTNTLTYLLTNLLTKAQKML